MSGVYRFTNKANGKIYIGSSRDVFKRFKTHQNKKNGCLLFCRAIKKYGICGFSFDVLEVVPILGLDRKEARLVLLVAEQRWLDELKPFGEIGYNMRFKADSPAGMEVSAETRAKIGIRHKGKKCDFLIERNKLRTGIKLTAEHKAKIGRKGRASGMKGRKHSEETRAKMQPTWDMLAIRNTGRVRSPETLKKMSDVRKGSVGFFLGKHHSEATKEVLRIRAIEQFKRSPVSEETRAKLSVIHKRNWITRKMTPVSMEARRKMSESKQLYLATKRERARLERARRGFVFINLIKPLEVAVGEV